MTWTTAGIPNLTGKVAVITGSNAGLGFHIASDLAGSGARVIMACRNEHNVNLIIIKYFFYTICSIAPKIISKRYCKI